MQIKISFLLKTFKFLATFGITAISARAVISGDGGGDEVSCALPCTSSTHVLKLQSDTFRTSPCSYGFSSTSVKEGGGECQILMPGEKESAGFFDSSPAETSSPSVLIEDNDNTSVQSEDKRLRVSIDQPLKKKSLRYPSDDVTINDAFPFDRVLLDQPLTEPLASEVDNCVSTKASSHKSTTAQYPFDTARFTSSEIATESVSSHRASADGSTLENTRYPLEGRFPETVPSGSVSKVSSRIVLPVTGQVSSNTAESDKFSPNNVPPPRSISDETPFGALPASLAAERNITQELFDELEELAKIVDISYCIGGLNSGIQSPFKCYSFCREFPDFELIQTWCTGMKLSDSCGFIALSHSPRPPRIIIAFRGTYSAINAVTDLTVIHEEYLPHPGNSGKIVGVSDTCDGCTVHKGFLECWKNTDEEIFEVVAKTRREYPDYQLTLIGHSMGGALAAFAGLDYAWRGWKPVVTTFGEPRVGNKAFSEYINKKFTSETYRRVTHIGDPVPLLPFHYLGFYHHAHEYYIWKRDLPFTKDDVRRCFGNEDPECIASNRVSTRKAFMEHREYFHPMGMCYPASRFFGGIFRDDEI